MASMSDVAMKFFEACEAGKGWEACKAYCAPERHFLARPNRWLMSKPSSNTPIGCRA